MSLEGPGQDITFFLVSTGLEVNPTQGTIGKYNWNVIKQAMSELSEITYEDNDLRIILDTNINHILNKYDTTPRRLNQVLFGVNAYNNSWNAASLTTAIDKLADVFYKPRPDEGSFSIDPYEIAEGENNGIYVRRTVAALTTIQEVNDFEYKTNWPSNDVDNSAP